MSLEGAWLKMSIAEIMDQMQLIRSRMVQPSTYSLFGQTTNIYLKDVNMLQEMYGIYIGKARAKYQEYSTQLSSMDKVITEYFQDFARTLNPEDSLKKIGLAIQKISEFLSFVNTLDTLPAEEKVPKASYDKLLSERNILQKTVEIMVQYKGLPELNTLLETARNNALPLDEHWVLAICSSNLIEAVVNKKLENLGEKADGNFEERYKKLCKVIKEKENRDISQQLPSAIYKVRNKLDHSSDSNRVTPKEARDISKMVIEFMNEVLQ
jgi:hypothetical protein